MKSMQRKEKGIASVEFTIVLPLLLLFLVAIGEFGNAFIRYNTLSKAVQNGARFAVSEVYGTAKADNIAPTSDIQNAVIYGNPNPADGAAPILESLTVNVSYDAVGKYVVVTAQYPYTPIIGAMLGDLLSDITLTASAVMRVAP
ncbi:TadE/TadG family type IV pilus assembly protein [Vibrio japonicus]|uniref:Pilus assembly protein n=1 Tax=Vibrio japonicus TaxID=1824638 RepID=A0ABY5LGY8_9VIBR|nr:TadE family protein [Vibrio japonicus]UUM30078.1 pilus assembly protein [Vibrio japonicus]